MRQTERANDGLEALQQALDDRQSQIWTALPGIVQSFNAAALTAVVQPSIKGQQYVNGVTQDVPMPLLVDCPVMFPRGGGVTLTFPVKAGDECLVIFANRCIDAWWQSGGVQKQAEFRMHDLSDGFCLPGPFSQATKISSVSTSSVQLRSNDGEAVIDLNPTTHVVTVTAPGGITLNGNVTVNGTLSATGNVTAGTSGTPVDLLTHHHTGVQAGSSNTGGPVG